MSGLLKSKVFKKNLTKWLVMYFGILGLFATVVTYSKYMSKINGTDQARAAKFKVDIKFLNKCEASTDNKCDYGDVRPTSEYEFYFQEDTSKLEVSAILATSIKVDTKLRNVKIYECNVNCDEGNLTEITDVSSSSTNDGKKYYKLNTSTNTYTLVDTLEKNKDGVIITNASANIKKYKITANYDNSLDSNYENKVNNFEAIKISYAADQIN